MCRQRGSVRTITRGIMWTRDASSPNEDQNGWMMRAVRDNSSHSTNAIRMPHLRTRGSHAQWGDKAPTHSHKRGGPYVVSRSPNRCAWGSHPNASSVRASG